MITAILLMMAQTAVPSTQPFPNETSPAPSTEAIALGQEIARSGVLAALLPLMVQQETEQPVAANPELPASEIARLRQVAAVQASIGISRIMSAQAEAYAARLTIDDLRLLAAHARSDAAANARAAMPTIIAAAMTSASAADFKGGVRAAFCANATDECQLKLP